MRVFAIFGNIEFVDGNAYVHDVKSSAFMEEDVIEGEGNSKDGSGGGEGGVGSVCHL